MHQFLGEVFICDEKLENRTLLDMEEIQLEAIRESLVENVTLFLSHQSRNAFAAIARDDLLLVIRPQLLEQLQASWATASHLFVVELVEAAHEKRNAA